MAKWWCAQGQTVCSHASGPVCRCDLPPPRCAVSFLPLVDCISTNQCLVLSNSQIGCFLSSAAPTKQWRFLLGAGKRHWWDHYTPGLLLIGVTGLATEQDSDYELLDSDMVSLSVNLHSLKTTLTKLSQWGQKLALIMTILWSQQTTRRCVCSAAAWLISSESKSRSDIRSPDVIIKSNVEGCFTLLYLFIALWSRNMINPWWTGVRGRRLRLHMPAL